jgi:type II secretory pathway component GspD/PulD (secretin)
MNVLAQQRSGVCGTETVSGNAVCASRVARVVRLGDWSKPDRSIRNRRRSHLWFLFVVAAMCLNTAASSAPGQVVQKVREAFDNLEQYAREPETLKIEPPATNAAQRAESNGAIPSGQRRPSGLGNRGQFQGTSVSDRGQEPLAAESLPIPPPTVQGRLPLAGAPPADSVLLSRTANGNIELRVRNQSLSLVLSELATQYGLNIVAANDIDALISITLEDVPLEQALTAILSVAGYTWTERNGIILITSLTDSANLPADVQGRQVQVFDLDYASATVVAEAVTNLVTPGLGKVTLSETDPADNRRTRELVIVEDLPASLARIAAYVHQIDQPPRQVLVEAHVLQVNLDDTTRCGVNLEALARLSGSSLQLQTTGFANEDAPQAFLATLTGGDLESVIQAIQTTTDSKTLGSPKLLVLNEQEAYIQVGEKLGFKVTTTTETSSQESVQFLDVGVILRIIPRITRDGRILLHVAPEVSTGEVTDGVPNSATTELDTDVMLNDGQGVVLGGLIQERDVVNQQKFPYLGEVKGIGWLFRRTERTKERAEIIFALIPRIQPYDGEYQAFEQGELVKAGVPLMHGPLCRTYRPWDPVLPDGKRVYRPLVPRKPRYVHSSGPPTSQYVVPPQPLPVQRFPDPHCDPEWQGAGAYGPGQPFLSGDLLALPPDHSAEPDGVEIITDRN